MVNMENAEEVMQILERFTRLKQKEIPKELDEYLQYVAKTGDTVFKWSSLKYLFREKLLNVMKHFHDTTPHVVEIPQYPNVDPFNYESMKSSLLERLELFNAAPFTIQRLCELLIDPRKQYSRIDKFMRALEKNILVVSTVEPGRKRTESENGDSLDSVVNGDLSLDVNVDIDMENESLFHVEAQNGGGGDGETESVTASVNTAGSSTATATANAEVKEKSATESPNMSHTADDDDILPNPKKPKLDLKLGSNESANSVATASGSVKELHAPLKVTEKDPSELMETPEIQEKSVVAKDQDAIEEEEENKENMVSCEKLKRKIPSTSDKTPPSKIDNEEAENSNALKKSKNKEKEIDESKDGKEETNNKEQVEKEEQEETEVDAAIKIEEAKQKLMETIAAEIQCVKADEKIIEKQETEKDEKHQKPSTTTTITTTPSKREASQDKQDNSEKQSSSTSVGQKDLKMTEALKADGKDEETLKKSNETNKRSEKADTEKHQKSSTSSHESPSKAKYTETSEEKVVHTEAINTMINSDEKQLVDSVSKSMKKSLEKHNEVEEKGKANVATENIVKEEKDTSKAFITQETNATTTTNLSNSDGEGTASVVSLQAANAVATTASKANVADALVTPSSAIKLATAPSASSIITPPIPITPTLALNDQPMDEQQTDVAIDNITEVTELNNTTESAAVSIASLSSSSSSAVTVEEVIMSEINCASSGGSVGTSGSSAMATDVIEPAKDEPSGMEVDDTSQEAMDQ